MGPLESKVNYTIVGMAVLLLTAALLSALLWLSVGFDQKRYNPYLVYMPESASSLSEDTPVKFNGVKVGTISEISLSKSNPQMVRLLIRIEEGILITEHTEATLILQGITGNSYLGLSATSPSLTPLKRTATEPFPVIPYKKSFFGQLEHNISEISDNVKRVFDSQNAKSIKKTLLSLESITGAISKNSSHMDKAISQLPEAISEFKTMVLAIKNVTKNIAHASNQVSQTMRAGKDGIGQLEEQVLPPATILLQRLDTIAADLQQVSVLLKQNPSVILRGTAPEKPGPGE